MRDPFERPTRWAVPLLAACLLAMACHKPESDLGLDVLDPNDTLGITVVDTTSLIAFTVPEPPVRTSGLSRNALGSYFDRDFGSVHASIVTQLRLSTNNVGAGQDNRGLVADSIVLSLVYDANSYAYGNLTPQRFRVFEIGEDLHTDSVYRSDHEPMLTSVNDLVAPNRGLFRPDPFKPAIVDGDTLKPQLRIPLDRRLGQRFLDAWGSADLVSNATFLQFFKGVWITPDNGPQPPFQAGVLYFNLLDAQSKVTLYYRVTRPGEEDTLRFDLNINENCVRYTRAVHDHGQASATLQAQLADSTLGQEVEFIQSLGGTRAQVRMPSLEKYPETGLRALAKAELVVPVQKGFYPFYQPPAQLFVFRKGDEGQDLILPDQVSGQGNIGGQYDADDGEYRFNITRWVQGVFNGTYANTGLSLVPGSGGIAANRVLISGPMNTEQPMHLRLTFTTY